MSPSSDETTVDVDDDIELLTEQIAALEELAQRSTVDDDDIYDLSIRWGAALAGRLPRLVHYSTLGSLTEADQRRFQSLREQLQAMSDVIAEYGLARPAFTDTPGDRASGRVNRLQKRLGLK